MDYVIMYVKGIGTIEGHPEDIAKLSDYLEDAAFYNNDCGMKYMMKGCRELGQDHLDKCDTIMDISMNIQTLLKARGYEVG